ncbi:hypothetical protein [Sulfolobus ellipsoid virus 1]|uniref:Uncharacterized protein n=1 Tax=Sulfolobus ellipsoid virus 1 TaxID=2056194 RepID=A0A2H4RBN1_9VIRU|nr:hypothetical protein FGG62_gp12 [Sulfolobus ellipsoid virus 1]ATY46490.1 hypothetical protein [Sulfolobus ellipsoid virus 1]
MSDETISYTEYMYKLIYDYINDILELKKKYLTDINLILAYSKKGLIELPKTEVKEVDD